MQQCKNIRINSASVCVSDEWQKFRSVTIRSLRYGEQADWNDASEWVACASFHTMCTYLSHDSLWLCLYLSVSLPFAVRWWFRYRMPTTKSSAQSLANTRRRILTLFSSKIDSLLGALVDDVYSSQPFATHIGHQLNEWIQLCTHTNGTDACV